MAADPDLSLPAHDTDRALDVWRRMPEHIRDTVSWVAHLLDSTIPLRAAEDEHDFARRHLAATPNELVSLREKLGVFSLPLVANAFAADLRRHPPYDVAGVTSHTSPKWQRIKLHGESAAVPAELVAAFAAGTLMDAPCVVSIDTNNYAREFVIHARVEDSDAAQGYLTGLLARARGEDNYLRGRCITMQCEEGELAVEQPALPAATRGDVIVPARVWAELDVNLGAIAARRELLRELGLGTNRGILLVGPPGTGKSAICRILAAELAGDVTVVTCEATAISSQIDEVYAELAHVAPALVILEDIDLVIAHRALGGGPGLHRFLNAIDGAMSEHSDVVTLATTNDVRALDPAAIRSSRFDGVIEVPLPDAELRGEILRRYLGVLAVGIDVPRVAAAAAGASGADLRELVRRAVLEHGASLDSDALVTIAKSGRWVESQQRDGLYL